MMNKKSAFPLLLFVAVLTIAGYASDATVERPTYSSGDYWIFIDGKGKSSKLEFLREERDKYVFRRGGTEVVMDFSLMDVSKARGFPGPIIRFPLKKGDWWKYEFTTMSATGTAATERVARYEAADYEKITVPAGAFYTFKIAVNIEIIGHYKKGYAAKSIGSATYWYAPDVKQIIKAERGEHSWELKEYKIK